MIEYTQSNLDPGNCWQTVVASVLEVPPERLPDQTVCDLGEMPKYRYQNELGAYLRKHHNLAYVSLQPYFMGVLEVRAPGVHFMSGETVRTPETKARHVVIARYGELLWDPHPSRAGLTSVFYWSFLVPYPKEWSLVSSTVLECHCPACGGYE